MWLWTFILSCCSWKPYTARSMYECWIHQLIMLYVCQILQSYPIHQLKFSPLNMWGSWGPMPITKTPLREMNWSIARLIAPVRFFFSSQTSLTWGLCCPLLNSLTPEMISQRKDICFPTLFWAFWESLQYILLTWIHREYFSAMSFSQLPVHMQDECAMPWLSR